MAAKSKNLQQNTNKHRNVKIHELKLQRIYKIYPDSRRMMQPAADNEMMDVDSSSHLSADSQPKSVGLV